MTVPPANLLTQLNRNGNINNPTTPKPLVTLEEFFDGNDDYGSIGYNFYPDQPSPAEFFDFFKQIRDRPEVFDVRVQLSQHEVLDEWPSTDTIWIITRSAPEEVASWLGDRFQADDMIIGWPKTWEVELYFVPIGMQPIGVWWD